ncbi:MAG TPA: DUF4956 domain-containing protein [Oligoflexia bacterium]|nr:DUF4956 domain-containing protein [Oligoflexia bacterium]HMR25303.1 DUF4956 domain-containing protein [Oligoflexia bacterium]
MDQLFSYFDYSQLQSPPMGSFDMVRLSMAIVLSFILSLMVSKFYQRFHRSRGLELHFLISLVLLSMVAAFIMQAVGNNLARAFSLAGALSIVRFRNAVKDIIDIVAIFFVMAIGIACGAGFFALAILSTVLISFLWWVISESMFAMTHEQLITLQFKASTPDLMIQTFKTDFKKTVLAADLRQINQAQNNENLYTFDLKLNGKIPADQWFENLKTLVERKNIAANDFSIYL